jgi:hypothetical protein
LRFSTIIIVGAFSFPEMIVRLIDRLKVLCTADGFATSNIERRCIEGTLEMGLVKSLDRLDAGAAVVAIW